MLEVKGLCCRYGKVTAVHDVTLTVQAGELVTLIGANGAGKTTTLRAISGLLSPAAGCITFEGENIAGTPARHILARGIAHCPEGRRVFPEMTVQENLDMGAYLRSDAKAVAEDMQEVFERFPVLSERRRQTAGTLSGGEQQMLAIGRALMSRPRLVLFDEPSLGLAPTMIERTLEVIAQIRARGTTVLMVEQNAYAALEMCDRSYVLESGQVILEGTGQELLGDPHVRKAYLGG